MKQTQSEKLYYDKKYLNDDCNSKGFLSSISYTVKLSDLLELKRSCAYHQNMKYTAVIFEIMVQKLKDFYKGNYFLQIWDDQGTKIYEKVLKYDIISWNIFFNYLVYKTDKKEESGSQIVIVDFQKDFKEIRIRSFVADKSFVHMGINQGLLYYANEKDIKIVDIQVNFKDSETFVELDPQSDQIGTYQIGSGCKLHGFFENGHSKDEQYLMCFIETFDNQIDFNRLYNWNGSAASPHITFNQYREVVQRDLRNDPIVKVSQVIMSSEFQFGISLRQSGKADLYWNYTLTQTIEEQTFSDVSSNYTSLFLKTQDIELPKILKIDIKWDSRIGIDVADKMEFREDFWFKIQNTQMKNSVKPFQATSLINTTFLIAYNNVVSTFDIIKKLWIDHYIMDEPVVDVLRNQVDQESDDYSVGIVLKSGKIFELETKKVNGEMTWFLKQEVAHNVGSGIKKVVSDWRDVASHYLYFETPNGLKIVGYQNQQIRDMTGDLNNKSNDEYMLRYISTEPTEDIAMYNPNKGTLKIYSNYAHWGQCTITFTQEFEITNYDIMKQRRIHTITEPISKEYLFLFDNQSVFIYNKKEKSVTEVKDMNIINLQLIDGVYIYALTNDIPSKKLTSGFYFYDLNQLVEKAEESFNFKLQGAIVGVNNLVDYYRLDERIAYMQDYNEVKIVPLLHRNCINMIGMQKRKNYVCFLKKKDKFIALDKNNTLTTWNVTTGKVVGQYKLKVPVVTENYEIYKCDALDITYQADWYQPFVLLIDSNTEVADVDDKGFFGDRLYTSLPNNTAYTAVEQKTWRNFKLLQIVSETEVRVACKFSHPYYGFGNYQRIYFSDDQQYMLERLVNQRAFVFKREDTGKEGECKWRFVRRLKQFPMDLAEATYANYLFSPDLQYYLDFDQSEDTFVITRTLDQSIYCRIPKGIMNPSSEDPKRLSKRFCWANNQQIKVINNEGIEKFIDIKDGQFKDINQDTIPMINLKEFDQEKSYQYYFQPPPYTIEQVEERLIRKYQTINSAICLQQITDKELLYDTIFEIDYSLKGFAGKIVIDTSFTYIHWKLAEMLANPKLKIKLKKFSLKDLLKTVLNVFPKGNTVMHYSYKQLNNVRKMFDVVNQYNSTLNEGDVLLEIPFIQNFKGFSPLHLCVEQRNYKSAEIFLQKLAETPLDSHARAIVDILPQLVEAAIPSLGTYLDKRLMQTQQLIQRGQRRGALILKDDLDYAVNSCELWPDMNNVDKILFSNDPRDAELRLEFLDMPKIHSYQEPIGDEFFAALANSDDIELFQYKSIQALIDYKWPLAREYTIKVLFIPFLLYHLTFLIYSNVFCGQYAYENEKDGSMWIGHGVLAALLYLFSIYFLANEVRQLYLGGLDYFKSVWNYSDLLPPILIIITISLKLNTMYNEDFEPNNIVYTIHSVATLLIWVKLLYFLRIFRSTGYLVRTITDVIYDMKVFLLILFIVYFGFGEAFLRLSEKSGEAAWIKNYAMSWVYSFRVSVGDNDTDTFDDSIQPTTAWILLVIAGILTNIVMLNLLISIISDSFANINEKSKEANYQERARIISENGYLIPPKIKNQQDDFDKYLIVASEVADSQDDIKNTINKAKQIEDTLVSFKDEFNKRQEELEAKLNQILEN